MAIIRAVGRVIGRGVELALYSVVLLFFYLTLTHFIYEVRTGDWQPDLPPMPLVRPSCN